jgi:aryl sulfotransferase
MTENHAWPGKAGEWHNHHFDSTIRNDFRFRDDDIVVATYAKSGTTWARRIAAPTHPRIIKTHLPADALMYSPQAKYIYIGRDSRTTPPEVVRTPPKVKNARVP